MSAATGTHISLIAHITQRELAQSLHHTETHNGFANRCLWTWVQRNSWLPEGGDLTDGALSAIARELRRALDWAAATPEILFRRDDGARKLWQDCYPALSQLRPAGPGEPWGLRGAASGRAEAQVLRLSAIYAALDTSPVVGLPHLQAALAVWDYCSNSAILLFGDSTGDAIADRILEALVESPKGLSKHQIRRLFHGHVSCDRIDAAPRSTNGTRRSQFPQRANPRPLLHPLVGPRTARARRKRGILDRFTRVPGRRGGL